MVGLNEAIRSSTCPGEAWDVSSSTKSKYSRKSVEKPGIILASGRMTNTQSHRNAMPPWLRATQATHCYLKLTAVWFIPWAGSHAQYMFTAFTLNCNMWCVILIIIILFVEGRARLRFRCAVRNHYGSELHVQPSKEARIPGREPAADKIHVCPSVPALLHCPKKWPSLLTGQLSDHFLDQWV